MPVPTSLVDVSTTAASNSPAGSESRNTSDDYHRQTQAMLKGVVSQGADITSASTLALPAVGSYFDVTGTTTVSAISSTNSWDGREITLQFDGILTLTHSSSFDLGGQNIVTIAGMILTFRQKSSGNWVCTSTGVSPINQKSTGFFTVPEGARINRFNDRVFVSDAASNFAGDYPESGSSWLSDSSTHGNNYLAINAQLLVIPEQRRYAITGASATSLTAGAGEAIALGAVIVNDSANKFAFGMLVEMEQTQTGGGTVGIEIAAKNASSANPTLTPYNVPAGSEVSGIQLSGGGDNALAPTSTNPSTVGINFTKTSQAWNTGINFRADAITGTDGSSGSTGTGVAINLARRHAIRWNEPTTGGAAAQIISSITTSSKVQILEFADDVLALTANNGVAGFTWSIPATVANRLAFVSVATGSPVEIQATGSDTNVGLLVSTKNAGDISLSPGTGGSVRFGTHTGTTDTAISGYITIKDSAGNSRKLAVIT